MKPLAQSHTTALASSVHTLAESLDFPFHGEYRLLGLGTGRTPPEGPLHSSISGPAGTSGRGGTLQTSLLRLP